AEVERLVLDLVAAEILCSSLSRKEDGREDQPREHRRQPARPPRGEAAAVSFVTHCVNLLVYPQRRAPTAARPGGSVRGNGRGLSCRGRHGSGKCWTSARRRAATGLDERTGGGYHAPPPRKEP